MNKKEQTLKIFAKKLAELSMENGLVSAEKVDAVLRSLEKSPPRKPKTVLKHYLYYIRQAVDRSRAIVEYSGTIEDAAITAIQKHLSQYYNRPITTTTVKNEALIAGFRISVGDDIFDVSVAGRLNNLAKSVR